MTDEAEDLAARIARGAAAQRILAEPLVLEAFEAVMADLRDQLVHSDPMASATREALYHQHLGLQTILGALGAWQVDYEAITEAQQAHSEEDR